MQIIHVKNMCISSKCLPHNSLWEASTKETCAQHPKELNEITKIAMVYIRSWLIKAIPSKMKFLG
jgi:hypothetical protein